MRRMSAVEERSDPGAEPRMYREAESVDGGDDDPEADEVGDEFGGVAAEAERCEEAPEAAAGTEVLVEQRQQPGDDEDGEQQRQRGQQAGDEDTADAAHW